VSLGRLPGGTTSWATDVTADGSTIVGWSQSSVGQRAFLWSAATGMVDIQQLLSTVVPSDWTLTNANAISADGTTIVGYGIHNGHNEAWVGTVPAPGALAALALAAAVTGRRRLRAAPPA
jgi:probable HAF family extracellular repeat protein